MMGGNQWYIDKNSINLRGKTAFVRAQNAYHGTEVTISFELIPDMMPKMLEDLEHHILDRVAEKLSELLRSVEHRQNANIGPAHLAVVPEAI